MTRKTRWTRPEAAEAIERLQSRLPGWHCWHVAGSIGADLFCAAPEGSDLAIAHGSSPGELVHAVAEYLDNTRERRGDPTMDDLRREFPAWEFARAFGACWAHLRDDPDVIIRDEDTTGLRAALTRWILRNPVRTTGGEQP